MKNKQVNIVLSGSGVKMMCFVGALQALEDNNYKIVSIVGSSGGSIIGSLYAFGKTPKEIKDIVMNWNYKWWVFQGLQIPGWHFGLFSSRGIKRAVRKVLGIQKIQAPKRCRLIITGSNLTDGQVDYFSQNIEVAKAVQISSTVPFGFGYIRHNGKMYVDGGLIDNYPMGFIESDIPSIGFLARGIPNSPSKVKWPWQYLTALLTAGLTNLEKKHIEDSKWKKTIALDAGKITGAMNFFITKDQKEALYQLGYQTTLQQLHRIS